MSDQLAALRRYPLHWRLFDFADNVVERLLPKATATAVPLLLLLPALTLIGLLVVGLMFVGEQSLHTLDPATFLLRKAYSLANYRTILGRSEYRELAMRSVGSAVLVSLICLILGFPYAYVMVRARSPMMKKLLLCCVFFPFLLGAVVRGFAWLVLLGRDGLVNDLLRLFGIGPVPMVYNMTGVLIALTQLYLPLSIIMIAPALTAIDESIDEAAQSLGAPWFRAFRTVILPMATPGLVSAYVVVLTLVFSDIVVPTILGGGRADFITNAIYSSYLETGDLGVGAALCMATAAIATGMVASFFVMRGLMVAGRRWRRA